MCLHHALQEVSEPGAGDKHLCREPAEDRSWKRPATFQVGPVEARHEGQTVMQTSKQQRHQADHSKRSGFQHAQGPLHQERGHAGPSLCGIPGSQGHLQHGRSHTGPGIHGFSGSQGYPQHGQGHAGPGYAGLPGSQGDPQHRLGYAGLGFCGFPGSQGHPEHGMGYTGPDVCGFPCSQGHPQHGMGHAEPGYAGLSGSQVHAQHMMGQAGPRYGGPPGFQGHPQYAMCQAGPVYGGPPGFQGHPTPGMGHPWPAYGGPGYFQGHLPPGRGFPGPQFAVDPYSQGQPGPWVSQPEPGLGQPPIQGLHPPPMGHPGPDGSGEWYQQSWRTHHPSVDTPGLGASTPVRRSSISGRAQTDSEAQRAGMASQKQGRKTGAPDSVQAAQAAANRLHAAHCREQAGQAAMDPQASNGNPRVGLHQASQRDADMLGWLRHGQLPNWWSQQRPNVRQARPAHSQGYTPAQGHQDMGPGSGHGRAMVPRRDERPSDQPFDLRPLLLFDLNGTLTAHTSVRQSSGKNAMRPGLHHLRRLQVSITQVSSSIVPFPPHPPSPPSPPPPPGDRHSLGLPTAFIIPYPQQRLSC